MRPLLIHFALIISTLSAAMSAKADNLVSFESGTKQVPLIELYTSEGCSSCPPADRWLSSLNDSPELWASFVPVAFHVDYWNYIGWPDRFAKQEYTQRQRRYAAEFRERTIYTPGVRQSGLEWRGWRREGVSSPAIETGKLQVNVDAQGLISASFTPQAPDNSEPLQLTLAVLGMSLESDVKRGENKGKKLKHDFVVLATTTLASNNLTGNQGNDQSVSWQGQLPAPEHDAPTLALAAWVTVGQSQVPIQATGGVIPSTLSFN